MSDEPAIEVTAATADRWAQVRAVMGVRGDPAQCWCQFFRLRGRAWEETSRGDNEKGLHEQVRRDPVAPGVLALRADEPVGWCAVAPKSSYPRAVASRTTGDLLDGVWSVTCFVVPVGQRRRGVATALLHGAVDFARAHGATTVEGYPVDPDRRSSVSSAELFHGTVSQFEGAGFAEVDRPSPARPLMRLVLAERSASRPS